MRVAAILLSCLLTSAFARAETAAIGPLTMMRGEVVSIEPFNGGDSTVGGEIELIDVATGAVIDRAPIVLAGGRGTSVAFAQNRVYVGGVRRSGALDSPASSRVVAAVLRFESDTVMTGQPRRAGADGEQKTIIGGFKSMSGMDSETEVVELVSGPILASGETTVHALPIGKPIGKVIGSVVKASDGSVVATFGGERAAVEVPASRAAEGEAYVIRLSVDRGNDRDGAVAISMESAAGTTAQVARWSFKQAWPKK